MAIIKTAERKLLEARASLDKMRDQEQRAFGDQQPFDHHLSAFLSAGMSVRGAFHIKQNRAQNQTVKQWKQAWEDKLEPEQKAIYEFMHENRNSEVHDSGPERIVEQKTIKIPVGGTYSDKSGTVTVMGSPSVLIGADTTTTISIPEYFFNVGGQKRCVTDACADYLRLLEKMVADFKAANG